MLIHLVISLKISFLVNKSSIRLIILLLIDNTSLKHSAKNIYFPIILDSLNKALKNNRGKNLDYSQIFSYIY